MNINTIDVVKSAQYITLGKLNKQTKYIWIALHGYGQLAVNMAIKLEYLSKHDHFVICPEGLNKFYWHENRHPVACWMTKDNRYAEIQNFTNYLDQIYNMYCKHVHHDVKIVLFGFSQGCATIWRWLHATQPKFDILINWAGWIPEDVSYLHMNKYLATKDLWLVHGDCDEFLNKEVIENLNSLIQKNRLDVKSFQFEGGHKIPREVLKQFIESKLRL